VTGGAEASSREDSADRKVQVQGHDLWKNVVSGAGADDVAPARTRSATQGHRVGVGDLDVIEPTHIETDAVHRQRLAALAVAGSARRDVQPFSGGEREQCSHLVCSPCLDDCSRISVHQVPKVGSSILAGRSIAADS
jgi:hypothetical protein